MGESVVMVMCLLCNCYLHGIADLLYCIGCAEPRDRRISLSCCEMDGSIHVVVVDSGVFGGFCAYFCGGES